MIVELSEVLEWELVGEFGGEFNGEFDGGVYGGFEGGIEGGELERGEKLKDSLLGLLDCEQSPATSNAE